MAQVSNARILRPVNMPAAQQIDKQVPKQRLDQIASDTFSGQEKLTDKELLQLSLALGVENQERSD